MYRHLGPVSRDQRRGGNTVYTHSRTIFKVRGDVGTQCTDTCHLYLKVRGEVGKQCTEIQDLYLKVRGEVGKQCTEIQDLYLKVRREVGNSVRTLRTSI